MDFLKRLFGRSESFKEKPAIKRTPKIQASLDRIEARKQKELKETEENLSRKRSLMTQDQLAHEAANVVISAEEQLRRLKKKGQKAHNDRLQADSGLMANSRMDLWLNTVTREDPPDTIAPQMRVPETVFNIETNTFDTKNASQVNESGDDPRQKPHKPTR